MSALVANARWELIRLVRSKRLFLLVIPVIAGPVGSLLAFLYFAHVQANGTLLTHGTALTLGLFVTGGLAGMVMLDLGALTVGEEIARRSHMISFGLPQSRAGILAGRLLVVFGLTLGAFVVGGLLVWPIASAVVPASSGEAAPLFDPVHLFEGVLCLLLFLGAIAVNASVLTRSSSEALVAGVLAGVVTVALAGWFTYEGQISMLFPAVLLAVAVVALLWSFLRFESLDT